MAKTTHEYLAEIRLHTIREIITQQEFGEYIIWCKKHLRDPARLESFDDFIAVKLK